MPQNVGNKNTAPKTPGQMQETSSGIRRKVYPERSRAEKDAGNDQRSQPGQKKMRGMTSARSPGSKNAGDGQRSQPGQKKVRGITKVGRKGGGTHPPPLGRPGWPAQRAGQAARVRRPGRSVSLRRRNTPQTPQGLATGLQCIHSPHHSGYQPSVALNTRTGPTFDKPNCWWASAKIWCSGYISLRLPQGGGGVEELGGSRHLHCCTLTHKLTRFYRASNAFRGSSCTKSWDFGGVSTPNASETRCRGVPAGQWTWCISNASLTQKARRVRNALGAGAGAGAEHPSPETLPGGGAWRSWVGHDTYSIGTAVYKDGRAVKDVPRSELVWNWEQRVGQRVMTACVENQGSGSLTQGVTPGATAQADLGQASGTDAQPDRAQPGSECRRQASARLRLSPSSSGWCSARPSRPDSAPGRG
eukprot:gene22901-biopygen14826